MQILVLVGSGEFTPAMDKVDTYLIGLLQKPRVAILPTASGQEDTPQKWIADGVSHFQALGVEAFGVPVLQKADAQAQKYVNEIKKANFIYFSGGDPGHLLNTLNNTQSWETILQKYKENTILAGASAGAMVFGNYVGQPASWEPALNLLPVAIFPHFNRLRDFGVDPAKIIKAAPESIQNNWMGIDEDTALVLEDNIATVMGTGAVILVINGRRSLYHADDSFTF